jgi:hypothetical protein
LILTNPISASEVGTLWLTYQEKTLILRVLEYFIKNADDQQAKNIMGGCGKSLIIMFYKWKRYLKIREW